MFQPDLKHCLAAGLSKVRSPMDEEIQTHLDGKRYAEAFELALAQYQNKVFRLAYSMPQTYFRASENIPA